MVKVMESQKDLERNSTEIFVEIRKNKIHEIYIHPFGFVVL